MRYSAKVLVDLRDRRGDILSLRVLFVSSGFGLLVGVWSGLSWTGEEEER